MKRDCRKNPLMDTMSTVRVGRWSLVASAAALIAACGEGDGDPIVGQVPGPPGASTPATVQPGQSASVAPSVAPVAPASSNGPVTPPTDGTLSPLGSGVMGGSGTSTEQYKKADVTRDGQNYYFMANGWGPGFESHTMSWNGTSFTVDQMEGTQGENWQPATYPTVFCGVYSDSESKACGLPAEISSLESLRTGWRWDPHDNDGEYNAAYDVWLGTGTTRSTFSGFLMVWLREPPGQQPAGSELERNVTVANVDGTWDLWTGEVNGRPIINWVRAEGQDSLELEFDVLDFIRDAEMRELEVPGTHILSVAVGFEIWNGPVTNLESTDFYVDPQPL